MPKLKDRVAILTLFFGRYGDDEGVLFEVDFYFPEDGWLFGSIDKKTYHGTFYTDSQYQSMLDKVIKKKEVQNDS